MIGLPTETMDDVAGIAELGQKVVNAFYSNPNKPKGRGVSVTLSASSFVPNALYPVSVGARRTHPAAARKAAPSGAVGQDAENHLQLPRCGHQLFGGCVCTRRPPPGQGDSAGVAARLQDGRLGSVLRLDKWMQAFRDCGLDPAFYASRQRPMDEVFPWDHIGCGTRKEHLKREWERSREAAITPDCMHQCAGCGASALLKGGKCHV